MIITLANVKGGVGKTSLCILLAQALGESGRRAAVLDMDSQGTARAWLRGCEGSKVAEYESGVEYDAVFVDTAPRLDALGPALARCDIALIPCSPSPADLWTTKATAAAVRPLLPKGARLRLVFNGVQHGTILARELPALAARIGVKALKASISRRQCFQHSAVLGWRALDQAAKDELFAVALELLS